jgi:hypothetical protein
MGLNPLFQQEGATKPDSLTVDSYEPLVSAARVMETGSDNQELVDLSNLPVIYVGIAASGFSQSAGTDNDPTKANWMIQQITITSGTSVNTLIGWGRYSNRTNLTYT